MVAYTKTTQKWPQKKKKYPMLLIDTQKAQITKKV